MAEIVLGIGTSHSPMLNTTPEIWPQHAARDEQNKSLWWNRKSHTYAELAETAGPTLKDALAAEVWQAKHEANQAAIAKLAEVLTEVNPDVIVAVGDDQQELFHEDNMPAMLVYWGEAVWNRVHSGEHMPPDVALGQWGNGFDDDREFPAQADLGLHIIQTALQEHFDVSHSRDWKRHGEGHAFGFVHRRLLNGRPTPIVPIVLNTFYPPNQPLPVRCFNFGESVRRAIQSWDSDARVCVLASGGLSHFVVDEDLDRGVLAALEQRDHAHLKGLDPALLNAGNSEIRNWIAVSAMAQDLQFKLVGYTPCYRTLAGTGGGWAFGYWD